MSSLKETLSKGEYWGRMVLVGKTSSGESFVGYAVTGRSPSSRARVLYQKKDGTIKTFPTNLKTPIDPEKELSEEAKQEIRASGGNPVLLIYNAIKLVDDRIVVSNGAQTDAIEDLLDSNTGLFDVMRQSHKIEGIDVFEYEPDTPNFTPRVTGLLSEDKADLAILRKGRDGNLERRFYSLALVPGRASVLPTYSGKNVPKGVAIPSFISEPMGVDVLGTTPGGIVEELYASLSPSSGDDFRVAAAAATIRDGKLFASIVNRSS